LHSENNMQARKRLGEARKGPVSGGGQIYLEF